MHSQRADVIRELAQSVRMAELTGESTKTQNSGINTYKKREQGTFSELRDALLTMLWFPIHTGWYVGGTQEFET